jgi:hypothetical protein
MTTPQNSAVADEQAVIAMLRAELDAALADKAVLAKELAQRDSELQARTAALAQRNNEYGERIQQQAATIDILRAMAASPDDPNPAFVLMTRSARELCNCQSARRRPDGSMRWWARRALWRGAPHVPALQANIDSKSSSSWLRSSGWLQQGRSRQR